MTDKIMIDDEVDALSLGQRLLITARAARRLGYEATFTPDGVLQIDENVPYESEEFFTAWEAEACFYVAGLMTARLVGDGLLYEDGVDENGNIIYKKVPEGPADA